MANKISNDKRTKGWNGQWKCIYEGEEMCVLDVKDDMEGNLDISNWQEVNSCSSNWSLSGVLFPSHVPDGLAGRNQYRKLCRK